MATLYRPEVAGRRHPVGRPVPRILVVDDEPVILDLLAEILGRAGYEVDVAPDGVEGMSLVRSKAYTLLIADVRMPKMDGFEFYNAACGEVERLPVLFITGVYDPEIPRKATEIGALGFLYKPFQVEEFVRKVENLVSISEAGAEPREEISPPVFPGPGDVDPAHHAREAERRIGELLAELREKEQRLAEARSDLLGLCRDLRAPLNALVNSLVLLADPRTGILSPSHQGIVQTALGGSTRVQNMVEKAGRRAGSDGSGNDGVGSLLAGSNWRGSR